MGKKWAKSGREMTSKPRALGNNAIALIDEALMANQMCMNELVKILNNSLTAEGVLRAVGIAIAEASKAQGKLNQVRYIGK